MRVLSDGFCVIVIVVEFLGFRVFVGYFGICDGIVCAVFVRIVVIFGVKFVVGVVDFVVVFIGGVYFFCIG